MPLESVRDFIVRTLLQDEASKGLDDILAKAISLTDKTYRMTVDVATSQAEKAIKGIEASAKAASNIDTSKSTKGLKEQDEATGSLGDTLKSFADQSQKAGDSIGKFFSRLDAGKLVIAGAAAGMVHYAKSALEVAESARLNIDVIKEQMDAGAMSFVRAGSQGFGTSALTRASLESYMTMTGYTDQAVIEKNILNTEKIMRSKWGQELSRFGVTNKQELLQTLSNPLDPTSDIGRVMAKAAPELFQQGALEREKMLVMREPKYANIINTQYGQAVIEQEARRRMAASALETIAAPLEDDTDSYRVRMMDFSDSFAELNAAIGDAVRPAASIVLQLMTAITRLIALAPEVPVLVTVVLALGTAFATLPPVLKLATIGAKAFMGSLLANPIGLAITAIVTLAVVLASLESRFGIFSKAWDHFAQSEIGKDLIAGFNDLLKSLGMVEGTDFMGGLGEGIEAITSRVAELFDKFDALYKMAKGGDLMGALRGGMELAFSITPMGTAMAITEGMMPQKRILDLILWVLQKANDTWDGFVRWLQDIYEGINNLLDPVRNIFEAIKGLYDKYFGNIPTTHEEKVQDLIKALEKNPITETATPMQLEWLARYALGEEKPLGMDYRQAGVGEPRMRAAREEREKQESRASGLPIPAPLQQALDDAGEVQETTNEEIINIAAENQPKLDEAAAEGDLPKFLYNMYGMSVAMTWDALTGTWDAGKAFVGGLLEKHATGGEVTKAGLAWVDEGEPIVPAEVARDSNLIDLLRGASEGGLEGGINLGGIVVNVSGAGGDGYELGRKIAETINKELSSFEFKNRVEQVVHRANRGYIG